MADLSVETALLAFAGGFVSVVLLTFFAALLCLLTIGRTRRRVEALAEDFDRLRDLAQRSHEAVERLENTPAPDGLSPKMIEQSERRLQKRLKDLEAAVQHLRVEIVEQQTAKFQVNEAIRRAMAPTHRQG